MLKWLRSARFGGLMAVAALVAIRFGSPGPVVAQPSPKLQVVTSTTVFVDMIQRVGGDKVEAFSLAPAGADVHTFQPLPRDLQGVTKAKVAIWNGMGLDEVAERIVAILDVPDLVTVTMSEGLDAITDAFREEDEDEELDNADERHHDQGNPHLWLSPKNGMRYVEKIRDALVQADAANVSVYTANADRYLAELRDLDTWAEQQIATIPTGRRKIVTFHDAFPYLAARYGLEVVGVVLKSPGREPSAREVAEVVSQIATQGIPTVFTEPQFNARILELAARDANVQVRPLYSETLDERVKSYVELIRFDVTSLVEGLR